ncbi:MAG: phosphatidate cytidylyltransferase, partial [Alphaproteobacteria bacterium]
MASNLTLRILSAAVLAPCVLGAVWFGAAVYELYNIPLYTILLAVFGAGLAWEWDEMFNRQLTTAGLWTVLFACLTAFLTPDNPQFALWVILLGTAVVYFKSDRRLSMAFGVLYICIPVLSLGYVYFINDTISRELVLWLFFVVWATDIGGYVIGCTFKGPKIAPSISAKKTWSGFAGGVVFASAVAYVFALFLKAYDYLPDDEGLFRR